MGPSSAVDALRNVLAMGADSAVHMLDESRVGSDTVRTSALLAAAVNQTGFDLIIAGNESTDGRGGVIAATLGERLVLPHLTGLETIELSESSVSGERASDVVFPTGALRSLNHMYASVDDDSSWVGFLFLAGSIVVMIIAWLAAHPPPARPIAALTGNVTR